MEQQTLNNNATTPPPTLYSELSPVDKNIASLKREVNELKELVRNIHIDKTAEDLQIPRELVEQSGVFKPIKRIKRGRGSTPILESEIREAQEHSMNASDAARYLNINYYTYRKFAKLYGIWKTDRHYRKTGLIVDPHKGMYPITRILKGEFPEYPVYRVKDKLIQSGIKKAECEQCGYSEHRITDGKMPLILNFEDGNPKNHLLENMKLLCYNCSFSSGRGYVRRGHKYHVLDDPDRIQGADMFIPNRF